MLPDRHCSMPISLKVLYYKFCPIPLSSSPYKTFLKYHPTQALKLWSPFSGHSRLCLLDIFSYHSQSNQFTTTSLHIFSVVFWETKINIWNSSRKIYKIAGKSKILESDFLGLNPKITSSYQCDLEEIISSFWSWPMK